MTSSAQAGARIEITVGPGEGGKRVDRFISEATGMTRSRVQSLIESSCVTLVTGGPVMVEKPSARMKEGDVLVLNIPEETEDTLLPEDIPLEILHHDPDLVVVNKPPGLVVYPAAGHSTGTLMNALRHKYGPLATVGGPLRPGVVHRLDKDTSGVMVVALSDKAYYSLVEQFRVKSTSRTYLALVNGSLKEDSGTIEAPIGRSETDRKKMSTKTRHGKEAATAWKLLMSFPGATLVEARLMTGRTHQIRVHFASIGHSVLGDRVYGRKVRVEYKGHRVDFPRQMLHARTLGFDHPATGERMEFSAEPPEDFQRAIDELKAL